MTSAHLRFEPATDKVAQRITKMRPSAVRNLFAAAQRDDIISLAGGMPDVSLLPKSAVRKAAKAASDTQDSFLRTRLAGMTPEERAAYVKKVADIANDIESKATTVEAEVEVVDEPMDDEPAVDDAE